MSATTGSLRELGSPDTLWRRIAPAVVALAAVAFAVNIAANVHHGVFGFDFEGTLWEPGQDILHGRTPFPGPVAEALRAQGNPAVYPPAIMLAAAPLSLLPLIPAALLWSLLGAGALALALWIVGVRDRRCYALCFVSLPFASSFLLGQLDGLLALACAVAWRYRERRAVAALAVAAACAAKLILWPLLVWLLATRRVRTAVAGAAAAAAILLGAWAVIGFAGLVEYPRLLAALAEAYEDRGYSITALGLQLGLPADVSRLLPLVAGALLLVLVVVLARRPQGDRRSFAAAIGAGIFMSPVVWLHYVVILLVPFAVARRRLDVAWLAVAALWLTPSENPASVQALAVGLGLALLVLALSLARGEPREARRTRPVLGLTTGAVE